MRSPGKAAGKAAQGAQSQTTARADRANCGVGAAAG